jgi:hypothetical protein
MPGSNADLRELELSLKSQLADVKKNWHKVPVPVGKRSDEILEFLEEHLTGRYYWDPTDITNSMFNIWLESEQDLAFYKMVNLP